MFPRKNKPHCYLKTKLMASDTQAPTGKNGKVREKVQLKPGFHLTDWIKLSHAAGDLSGRKGEPQRNVSFAELADHSSQFDCWTAYNGKVYNISQYIHYHPGGVPILMRGAGKDCTALFNKYHRWVNIESMLSKCVIGKLINDEKAIEEENDDNLEELNYKVNEKEISLPVVEKLVLDDKEENESCK